MSKFYDAIMGLVVGDALGVPFEFRPRDTFKATGMIGHGTHNQPAGTWSDDSSMTIATISSLCDNEGVDLEDMMAAFAQWLKFARFTPYGIVFDIGRTTFAAIQRWLDGYPEDLCGLRDEQDNGNGSLMRILPLAFVPNVTGEDVWAVSALTHAHEISMTACEIYLGVAQQLLHGADKLDAVVDSMIQHGSEQFTRLSVLDLLLREDIKSGGYVVDTLEAALWCLLTTDNYRDCVLTAVNLGDDTDTVAAIAGGLAGILYGIGGEKGIPEEWIDQIPQRVGIKSLCDRFDSVFGYEK